MKCETKSIVHLVCPKCGDTKRVDHLEQGRSFGPWVCDGERCDLVFSGKVNADGTYDIDATEEPRRRGFALLRFRDVFMVLDQRYGRIENPDYFYHSHQCPTNFLGRVEEVFDAEGKDPHGLLRFVTAIDDTPETAKRLEECYTLAELFALFGTDGQPAPTEWPEKNRGVLPFIAELQREYANKGDA